MNSTPRPDIRRQMMLTVATVMLIYVVTLWLMPRDGFWINDNGLKFIQTEGLLLNDFEDASIPWPGRAIDPDYLFKPLTPPFGLMAEGRLYGFYSLPFAALSALPYKFLGFEGLYILPLLGALLLLLAVGQLARLLPGQPVRSAVWLTALGTPIWFYSVTFWEHVPAASLTTLSVLFCLRYYFEGASRHVVYSAALLAASIYFRDELYLFGLPLLLVIALARPFNWRTPLLFGVTAVGALLPLWLFNWLEFGNILGIRLAATSPVNIGLGTFLSERPDVWRFLFLNGHENAWLSFLACAPFLLLMFWYPRVTPERFQRAMLGLGVMGLMSGLIVASGHMGSDRPVWWLLHSNGLFAASPLLIWAFVRTRDKEGQSPDPLAKAAGLLRLIALIYAILLALIAPGKNINGIHWGCRLLLPLYPLLGLLVASNLCGLFRNRSRKWLVGGVSAAVVMTSVLLQVYSLGLLQKRKSFTSGLNQLVAEQPEEVVAAIGWFVPQELSTNFYDKEIFLVTTPPQFNQLLDHLRRHQIERVLVVSSQKLRHPAISIEHRMNDGLNFVTIEIGKLEL